MTKHDSKKHLKSAWISRKKNNSVKKPWGYEKIWAGFNGIHGKTLFIAEGKKTSLKFHKLKTEVLYLTSGKAEVLFGNQSAFSDPVANPMQREILYPGDALLVQSECPYRIIALEDSEIIEIGNHNSDKPVRVLDEYGRESKNIENLLEVISENS